MGKMHVKTGDTVVIIAGKDKGKQGKVIAAYPKKRPRCRRRPEPSKTPYETESEQSSRRYYYEGSSHSRFQRYARRSGKRQTDSRKKRLRRRTERRYVRP